jgi:chemotaxis protein CheD
MQMRKIIDISTGEFRLAREKVVLRALALGSCIGLVAYDSSLRIGAVAHIMLPGRSPEHSTEKGRYAEDAMERLLVGMIQAGSELSQVETCLVGAANVLKRPDDTICQRNIQSLKTLLKQKHIPIRATALGGTERRNALLYVPEGRVTYTQADQPERLLWQFESARELSPDSTTRSRTLRAKLTPKPHDPTQS